MPTLLFNEPMSFYDETEPEADNNTEDWETTSVASCHSDSVVSSVYFPTPERSFSPTIDNTKDYTRDERLDLALASYFAKLEDYENTGREKPYAAPIAREYNIGERTLQLHIREPTMKTLQEQHASMQKLNPAEESALLDRLLFLDSWNVPTDREQVVSLGEHLLQQREPDGHLGNRWYYNFRRRHEHEIHFVYCKGKDKKRANAEGWKVTVDFYKKVKILQVQRIIYLG